MDEKFNKGKLTNMQQVKTYKKVTEIENIDNTRLRKMHAMWSRHFLDSKTRDFIFKFYNNILGTNQRVNKFNPATCPSCTFCNISNTLPAPLESFRHIFYDCPSVKKILIAFFNKFMNISLVACDVFFGGTITNTENKNEVFQLCMDILRYNIWLFKLEKKLPITEQILNEVDRTFVHIFKISNKTKIKFTTCIFLRGNEQHEHGE